MQVIGLTPAFAIADAVSGRSTRPSVSEWARRVIRRHVKRTPSLLVPIRSEKGILAAAKVDGLPEDVTARIVEAFRSGEEVFMPAVEAFGRFSARAGDTMDFMESLPDDDRRIRRIERLSWIDAEKMSEDWHLRLAKARKVSRDIMAGVRKIHEFADGSFMAELTTKGALSAEGGAMGHCVGGYWDRVAAGERRIVSLRDASGHPHVTVELLRAKTVSLDTGEEVQVRNDFGPGVNSVVVNTSSWYCPQIRGKSNQMPVERYAALLRQWLREASIPTDEPGFSMAQGERMVLFSYKRGDGWLATRDGTTAFEAIKETALSALSAPTPATLTKIDKDTGLIGVIPFVKSVEAVEDLLCRAVPLIEAQFRIARPANPLRYVSTSGIEKFLVAASRATGRDASDALETVLIEMDGLGETVSRSTALVQAGPSGIVEMVRHEVSMVGLQLMKSGGAKGREGMVLDALKAKFSAVLAMMRERPDAYHAIAPVSARVTSDDIVRAFYACGLGQELNEASAVVREAVKRKVRMMRTDVSKRRIRGEQVNLLANQLGDGWEGRLAARQQNGYLVGPEAPKAFDPKTALAAAQTQSQMKTYSMPRR
jgi:hypothetical protein